MVKEVELGRRFGPKTNGGEGEEVWAEERRRRGRGEEAPELLPGRLLAGN